MTITISKRVGGYVVDWYVDGGSNIPSIPSWQQTSRVFISLEETLGFCRKLLEQKFDIE